MIRLGVRDSHVQEEDLNRYFEKVKALTGQELGLLLDEGGNQVGFTEPPSDVELTVSDVQTILKHARFYPTGGIDGICGYRTSAAIRLFQEYVRTSAVGAEIGVPDGVAGSKTFGHLKTWRDQRLEADWSEHGSEHAAWIAFLERVKQHYMDPANRTRQIHMVEAYAGPSDTRKVADWDFDSHKIHIVGVRRAQVSQSTPGLDQSDQKFDDIMVLLVNGMVFMFQGSTEPGHTSHDEGAPFLVQGQHDYRLGWHRGQYQALKPATNGVLVVRSKDDYVLTERDLLNPDGTEKAPEPNPTINVHWAGRGEGRRVNRWSEGCQVIAGSGYINHRGDPVSCRGFVALNVGALSNRQTKGAYNVLTDLVAAFSSDADNRVLYTLLAEKDLELGPEVAARLEEVRRAAQAMM
jgi:hypothetical protein